MGHRHCCWLPCLASRIWHCGLVHQHSRSQALETTLRLQGSSLLFCLTLTGRMNTPLPPSCLLPFSATLLPLGTVPAGLGHCNFSLLSYSVPLCMCLQTHTIHLSPVNTPTKSLAADSDHPLFFPAPLSSNPFSNSRSTGYDIMSGCRG